MSAQHPAFAGFNGALDAKGRAKVSLVLGDLPMPTMAGQHLFHAFAVLGDTGEPTFASHYATVFIGS